MTEKHYLSVKKLNYKKWSNPYFSATLTISYIDLTDSYQKIPFDLFLKSYLKQKASLDQ